MTPVTTICRDRDSWKDKSSDDCIWRTVQTWCDVVVRSRYEQEQQLDHFNVFLGGNESESRIADVTKCCTDVDGDADGQRRCSRLAVVMRLLFTTVSLNNCLFKASNQIK